MNEDIKKRLSEIKFRQTHNGKVWDDDGAFLITTLESCIRYEEIYQHALEKAAEFTAANLENMEYFFDNKRIPTFEDVNQCAIADASLLYAIGKMRAMREEVNRDPSSIGLKAERL